LSFIGVNFINVLLDPFRTCATFLYLYFSFVFFWRKNIVEKAARKTLRKLTRMRTLFEYPEQATADPLKRTRNNPVTGVGNEAKTC
jgi:hypothetical protein